MEAYDSSYPGNRVYGNLTVNVNRNKNGPVFFPKSYTNTIPADFTPGQPVIFLSASDSDNVSSVYPRSG